VSNRAANHEPDGVRVFRYSRLIRYPVFVASAFWAAATVLLVLGGESRLEIFGGVLFFVVFFLFFGALYWRTAIRIDGRGIAYQGPWRKVRAGWSEVVGVDVYSGLFREYHVVTRAGSFAFTNLLVGHRELVAEIGSRAQPRR